MKSKPGKKLKRQGFVSLVRKKNGRWIPVAFGKDVGRAMKALEKRMPTLGGTPDELSIRPCSAELYACRDMLDYLRIGNRIWVPTDRIPVRIAPDTGIADLGIYRSALVCAERVLAVGRSPGSLLASLVMLHRHVQNTQDNEMFYRMFLLQNARIIPCSEQLYQEAVAAGHGPGATGFRLDTVGEYRSGVMVSPDEGSPRPWAYAVEIDPPGKFAVYEFGESYNELIHRCTVSSGSATIWTPELPSDIAGTYAISRCTPTLYTEIIASPWYQDRTRAKVLCTTNRDGLLERL